MASKADFMKTIRSFVEARGPRQVEQLAKLADQQWRSLTIAQHSELEAEDYRVRIYRAGRIATEREELTQ